MPEWFKGTVCKTVVRQFESDRGLCGCSSVGLERWFVAPKVVGSSPINHPKGSLVQRIRTFRYGRKGWEFESLRNHNTHASGEKVSSQSPKLLLGVRIPPGVLNKNLCN